MKERIYNLIREDDENDLASNIIDGVIIGLVLLNVAMVILDTFPLPPTVVRISAWVEIISVIIFTVEYALRLWTCPLKYPGLPPLKARLRYIASPMAVVDLLAILPFYIPLIIPFDLRVLRVLRSFRLLRLFKIDRYTGALSTIVMILKKKASQLLASLMVVAVLMVMVSVLIYSAEHTTQPDVFQNAFSGLWWAVATLTTVGYGDIYPVTGMGKLLSGVIALLGIGLVAVPTGIISSGFIEQMGDKETAGADETGPAAVSEAGAEERYPYCPHCGKKLPKG